MSVELIIYFSNYKQSIFTNNVYYLDETDEESEGDDEHYLHPSLAPSLSKVESVSFRVVNKFVESLVGTIS